MFFLYAFAEDEDTKEEACITCSSTPNEMQLYINFQVEMLGALELSEGEVPQILYNRQSGLFAGGFLSVTRAFIKSTILKIKETAKKELETLRSAAISTVLLYKMNLSKVVPGKANLALGISDTLGSFFILFENEALHRDYKLLQELDMSINDVIRDMGQDGIWDDNVSDSVLKKISDLQNKYAQPGSTNPAIFDRFYVSGNVKNKELLTAMLKLNSTMKGGLHNAKSTSFLEANINYLEKAYHKGNIIIEFNDEYVESFVKSYYCAYGKECNKSLSEALKKFGNISQLSVSFSKAKKTFKDANYELVQAIGTWGTYGTSLYRKKDETGNTGALTDRQIQLLRTVYGIDAAALNDSQKESLALSRQNVKEQVEPLKDAINDAINGGKKIFLQGTKSQDDEQKSFDKYMDLWSEEDLNQVKSELFFQNNISFDDGQGLIEILQQSADNILEEKKSDRTIMPLAHNRDTHYFVEIGSYIRSIVSNDIENVTKNLGEACEYQCANKGVNNCYADYQ